MLGRPGGILERTACERAAASDTSCDLWAARCGVLYAGTDRRRRAVSALRRSSVGEMGAPPPWGGGPTHLGQVIHPSFNHYPQIPLGVVLLDFRVRDQRRRDVVVRRALVVAIVRIEVFFDLPRICVEVQGWTEEVQGGEGEGDREL